MSKPTTPTSRYRTASSAISVDRAACRIAVSSVPTRIGVPAARASAEPASNPASTASTTSGSVQPALEVLLRARTAPRRRRRRRRPGRARTPGPPGTARRAVCITADRVGERLQVPLQRARSAATNQSRSRSGSVAGSRGRSRRPARRSWPGAARRRGGRAAAPSARAGSPRTWGRRCPRLRPCTDTSGACPWPTPQALAAAAMGCPSRTAARRR